MEFGDAKIGKETQKPLGDHDESNVCMDWQTNTEGHGDQLTYPLTTSSAAGDTDTGKEEDDTLPEEKNYKLSNDDDTEVICEREPKKTEERTKVDTAGIASSEKYKNENKVIEDKIRPGGIYKLRSGCLKYLLDKICGRKEEERKKEKNMKDEYREEMKDEKDKEMEEEKVEKEKMEEKKEEEVEEMKDGNEMDEEKVEEKEDEEKGRGMIKEKEEDMKGEEEKMGLEKVEEIKDEKVVYSECEIHSQPDGKFKVRWFFKPRKEENHFVKMMKTRADTSAFQEELNYMHILIFEQQDEESEANVENKPPGNIFVRCFGGSHHIIKEFIDPEFSFKLGSREVDIEKAVKYSHTFLSGNIHNLDVTFTGEKNSLKICRYHILNSFTGSIEMEWQHSKPGKPKKKHRITVSESNLKVAKEMTLDEHVNLLNHLLHCCEKLPKYDYCCLSKEKDKSKIEELDKFLKEGIQKMISGEESSPHVKEVVFLPNEGNYQEIVGKILLKAHKRSLGEFDLKVDVGKVEKILHNCGHSPDKLSFHYKLESGKKVKEKLIDCIRCQADLRDQAYFHHRGKWYKCTEDLQCQVKLDFVDFMRKRLISESESCHLPIPLLEYYKSQNSNKSNSENTESHKAEKDKLKKDKLKKDKLKEPKELIELKVEMQVWDFKLACQRFLHAILAEEQQTKDVLQVVEQIYPDVSFEPPPSNLDSGTPEWNLLKFSGDSEQKLKEVMGDKEFSIFCRCFKSVEENEYNKAYVDFQKVTNLDYILGDTILVYKIELYDILKIERVEKGRDRLYLYHVKRKFLGDSIRAVSCQIQNAADLIQKSVKGNAEPLRKYYDVCTESKSNKDARQLMKKICPTCDDFINLFKNSKIVFVYAFTDDNLSRTTKKEIQISHKMLHRDHEIDSKLSEIPKKDHLVECGFLEKTDNKYRIREYAFYKPNRDILRNKGLTKKTIKEIRKLIFPVDLRSLGSLMDLVVLGETFDQRYPEFELKVCQIKSPWYWAVQDEATHCDSSTEDRNTSLLSQTSSFDTDNDELQKYHYKGARSSEFDLETDSGQGSMETNSGQTCRLTSKGTKRGPSPTGEHCKKVKADNAPEDD